MLSFSRLIIFAALIAVIGVVGYLATFDPPPPTAPMEKAISDERFAR